MPFILVAPVDKQQIVTGTHDMHDTHQWHHNRVRKYYTQFYWPKSGVSLCSDCALTSRLISLNDATGLRLASLSWLASATPSSDSKS